MPVSPDNTDLTEALARVSEKSASERMADKAGGDRLFNQALTKCRAQPILTTKSGHHTFSKSAGESADEGESQTGMLHRHALEQTRRRLSILGDKLNDAAAKNADSPALPHIRAAQAAHREATKHISSLITEDED